MGIVFPLVGPLAWRLGDGDVEFLHHCFACILGASIFGNVCSPISDTTILTSLATGQLVEMVVFAHRVASATIILLISSLSLSLDTFWCNFVSSDGNFF